MTSKRDGLTRLTRLSLVECRQRLWICNVGW